MAMGQTEASKKPGRWIKEKYFHSIGQRNWVFCGEVEEQDGTTRKVQLFSAHTVPIERHTKIKGDANPYDPTWEMYFEERLGVKMAHNLKGKRIGKRTACCFTRTAIDKFTVKDFQC